jgi:hypothetical protein
MMRTIKMNQLESTKTIIVKDFNHARKLSIEKWTVIRDLIAEAFNAGTVKCGFCDLARQRDNLSGCFSWRLRKLPTELTWFIVGMAFGLGFLLSLAVGYWLGKTVE